MAVQQRISRRLLKQRVGSVVRVLVDSVGPQGALARTASDAPQIDGVVQVASHRSLKPGEFSSVLITGSDAHDLMGEVQG
jgi:ribosomal protein S12 methylthiotransferase